MDEFENLTAELPGDAPAADTDDMSLEQALEAGYDKLEATEPDGGPAVAEAPGAAAPADPAAAPEPAITARAPVHWAKEDKAFLEGLPSDHARVRVQQWRRDMQSVSDRRVHEVKSSYSEVDSALEPLAATLQQHGMSKGQAVASLVNAHQALTSDPGEGLAVIAGQYAGRLRGTDQAVAIVQRVAQSLGVNLNGTAAQPGQQQAPQHDPAAIAEQAAQRLWDQREAREIESSARGTLQAFIEAKGPDGQAKYPHYEAAKPAMQGLLAAAVYSGRRMTLEEAYEQAVWTKPELRQAMSEQQRKAAAQAAEAQRRAKTAAARAAGTPISRGETGRRQADGDQDKSLDELLNTGYDERFGAAAH